MHDGPCLRPGGVDVQMHPPLGRGKKFTPVAPRQIHLHDMLGTHLLIGDARGGDEKSLVGAHADIAGGALIDALNIHGQTGVDHLLAQGREF